MLNIKDLRNPGYRFRRGRVILESDNLVVLPALGSFVPGYLVIVPKYHRNTILDFLDHKEDFFNDLAITIAILVVSLFDIYQCSYVLIFEHGEYSKSVEHAHINLVPVNFNVDDLIARLDSSDGLELKYAGSFRDFVELYRKVAEVSGGRSDYVLIIVVSRDLRLRAYIYRENRVERQRIRKIICEILCKERSLDGKEGSTLCTEYQWDWRRYPYPGNIVKTFNDFREYFSENSSRDWGSVNNLVREFITKTVPTLVSAHIRGVDNAVHWGLLIAAIVIAGLSGIVRAGSFTGWFLIPLSSLILLCIGLLSILQVLGRAYIHYLYARTYGIVRNTINYLYLTPLPEKIIPLQLSALLLKCIEHYRYLEQGSITEMFKDLGKIFPTALLLLTITIILITLEILIEIKLNQNNLILLNIPIITTTMIIALIHLKSLKKWLTNRTKNNICTPTYKHLTKTHAKTPNIPQTKNRNP
ncbi:MAG: hypothetical protein GXO43_02615 [Crenarchaeota archaeon]|nr:hypothetical protein [Thermoproteota archaeon]